MKQKLSIVHAQKLNSLLKTKRLILEPVVAEHAALLFDLMQDKAIYHWISATPPKSVEQLRQSWLKQELRLAPDCDEAWLNWAVRRSSDGVYVGKLDAEVNSANVATNIGYLFFPEHWGQGYASESVLAVSDHLIQCGVMQIAAAVTRGNEASYRVLEKAGFIRSGIIPDNDVIRGIKYDDVEFIKNP